MRRLSVLLSRVRSRLRQRDSDQDLPDQINAHLEEATEEYVRQGLSPTEARRAARLDFGGIIRVEEACRDLRAPWYQDVSKDLGYGLRMLRRSPGFAAVAIVSLAVGIGANSAIFSIVNSMLLRPRAVANPEQLVELYTGERHHPYETTSYPSYVEFRDRNEVFSGLATYGIRQFRLGDANNVEQVWGEAVSGNYFDVLGLTPHRGRAFGPNEDVQPAAHPVVVINDGLWVRRFNADPNLIGQPVTLNGHKLTVVGIAPPQYTGAVRGLASEVWVPMMMMPVLEPGRSGLLTRSSRWLTLIGRLQPGKTIEQARARFDLLSREMQAAHPDEWKSREGGRVRELFVTVLPERDTRIHPAMEVGTYSLVALLVVVVNLVMLIACMNLAGMLLARAVVRRKEIAVRLALGAGRLRVVRQLIVESLLLSLIAGAAGVALGVWVLDLALAYMPAFPEGVRLAIDLRLDWRVLAYTTGVSTAAGVLFGLVPALQSSKGDVSTVLKDDAAAFAGGYRKSRIRAALVVGQVALSLLLLIAAGLVLRSLEKVRPTRLGFSSDDVVVAFLNLNETRYKRAGSQDFYRRLSERISSFPGVRAVSLVDGLPGGFMGGTRRSTEIEGYTPSPGESLEIDAGLVGPRYFTNMKVPIVQGRDFDERDRDGAPCVAIVNEAFGRRYFSGATSAIGKHLAKFDSDLTHRRSCEIVGVVRDERWQSLRKDLRPFYWMPLHQSYKTRVTVMVHTAGNPANHIAAVRRAAQELDPLLPVADVQTLAGAFSTMAYPFRLLGIALGACGMIALLLATIGVYGIVSYSVAQRTRELGIRMALGAVRQQILKLVIGQGMVLVAWGLTAGLLLSLALTRVLTSSLFGTELLFGVSATDAVTFTGVTIVLAVVALVACCIPALRATKVDPLVALRYE